MRLRALAPAKINLCLFLGGLRADGRHELVTLFESLSLCDELTLATLEAGVDEVVCPAVTDENLAMDAIAALRARGWSGPTVRIEIVKRIPIAGGMAGGSADAAAALRLAMAVAPGRAEEVDRIAAALGADVPAQLLPGVAVGRGAGELVEHVGPLAPHAAVVLPSARRLPTAEVFREADRLGLARDAEQLERAATCLDGALRRSGPLAPELIVNDLQPAALSLCPSIGDALGAARAAGADQALVSGSGPTVVGLWWGAGAAAAAAAAAGVLAARFPGAVVAEPIGAEPALPELID